jgi:hypothetical protein
LNPHTIAGFSGLFQTPARFQSGQCLRIDTLSFTKSTIDDVGMSTIPVAQQASKIGNLPTVCIRTIVVDIAMQYV